MGKRTDDSWHAWRETRDGFVEDMRLREWGWEIYRRPDRGPVLWRLAGSVPPLIMTHAEAMASVKRWQQEQSVR